MDRTRKKQILTSVGILVVGCFSVVLFPTSERAWIVLSVCFLVVLLQHTFLRGLLEGLASPRALSSAHTPPPSEPARQQTTRADIVSRYVNAVRAGAIDREPEVRECLREIAGCEGWLDQAPLQWERLWRWRKRGIPEQFLELGRSLEKQFRDREAELTRKKVDQETEELWQNHAPLIARFLEIAERKVSVLDDYGDERWDLLPREIEICIRKISAAAGDAIMEEALKDLRKTGHLHWGAPQKYDSLVSRLTTAFIQHHATTGSPRREEGLDDLSGVEFETYVARILKAQGYDVSGTPATCDQGADLIAKKGDRVIVVQAKRYKGPVGNKAVQEVVAAVRFYAASEGWVVTNATFTPAAKALAQKNGVRLIDGDELYILERTAGQ